MQLHGKSPRPKCRERLENATGVDLDHGGTLGEIGGINEEPTVGRGSTGSPGSLPSTDGLESPQGRQAGADGTQLGPCEVRQKLQERFTTKIGQATYLLSYAFLHEHSRNEQDHVNALGLPSSMPRKRFWRQFAVLPLS